MNRTLVSVAPILAVVMAGCGVFDSVEPDRLTYRAEARVVTSDPTMIVVSGIVRNDDVQQRKLSYGACEVGARVVSTTGPAARLDVRPWTGACDMILYTRILAPGESFVIGEVNLQLTGTVRPGQYNVTGLIRMGQFEASAGVVDVR